MNDCADPAKEGWTLAAIYDSFPVEQLRLDTRTHNALRRAGITTVGDMMNKTVRELLDIRNLGVASLSNLLNRAAGLDLEGRVRALEDRMASVEDELGKEEQ